MLLRFLLLFSLSTSSFAFFDAATVSTLFQQIVWLKKQYSELKQSYGELKELNKKLKESTKNSKDMAEFIKKQGDISNLDYNFLDYNTIITHSEEYLKKNSRYYKGKIEHLMNSDEYQQNSNLKELPNRVKENINKNYHNYLLHKKQEQEVKEIKDKQSKRLNDIKSLDSKTKSITKTKNNNLDSIHHLNQQNQMLIGQNEQVIDLLSGIYEAQTQTESHKESVIAEEQKSDIQNLSSREDQKTCMTTWFDR